VAEHLENWQSFISQANPPGPLDECRLVPGQPGRSSILFSISGTSLVNSLLEARSTISKSTRTSAI